MTVCRNFRILSNTLITGPFKFKFINTPVYFLPRNVEMSPSELVPYLHFTSQGDEETNVREEDQGLLLLFWEVI